MKLVSYISEEEDRIAILIDDKIYPLTDLDPSLPDDMNVLLWEGEDTMDKVKHIAAKIAKGEAGAEVGILLAEVELMAPVPYPTSCRDAYAFRQHVAAARTNRGVDMIPEFDQYPIFYFTNHNAITGPGEIELMKDHFEKMDFELEVAVVIGKPGRNITAADADDYIAGYCIMNDWSARTLQMEEMKLNLGPAKGKDFATSIGPFLLTADELKDKLVPAKDGHVGNNYDLPMKCWVNGKLLSEGNMKDMDWTFAEIIERVSYGVDLLPGDVIGSGTVGTGCLLELNGTGLRTDPDNYKVKWLEDGDEVVMEIGELGRLENTIKAVDSEHSILALKKNTETANS